ncbi:MAG: amidohydrolase [Planctomycetes bacterium]|nr:amidohydrolase [Planctomycetota bacterium]
MLNPAVVLALATAVTPVPQDLVLKNATVHTGSAVPWDGPIVVHNGRIAAPGTGAPEGTTTIDLGGAFVLAGLQDAHGHLLGLGSALANVDLVGTRSYDEVIDRVVAAAGKQPKGSWILGRGWDQNDWADKSMPHHAELSAAVPDHPVWLVRIDGHAGLLNLRGLYAAGVRGDTEAPPGGKIHLDDSGEPTGVLVDAAMASVPTPELGPEQIRARLLVAQEQCLRHGLTCVHDAGVSKAVLEEMRLLDLSRQWQLRTYVMLAQNERALIAKGPWRSRDGLIEVRAVKGYADGALGSRGAALLEPYADDPGNRGLVGMPKGAILELAQRCADHGMQLCVHAIGDKANRTVLDAYAEVKVEGGLAARRFRIEHAQVIAADDFARCAALGVLPAMQPTHLTSDMPWATDRLGPERVLRAYAWRSFLGLGVMVPFGSDFPVESVDPRKGLFAAVTTCAEDGEPKGGFRPDQKLSRAEAIAGFTAHAAYGMFAERDLGTIATDKIADLTVFDTDLLTCRDEELLLAKVLLTIVGGRVVYDGRGR